jgi:hypothetical protein
VLSRRGIIHTITPALSCTSQPIISMKMWLMRNDHIGSKELSALLSISSPPMV